MKFQGWDWQLSWFSYVDCGDGLAMEVFIEVSAVREYLVHLCIFICLFAPFFNFKGFFSFYFLSVS